MQIGELHDWAVSLGGSLASIQKDESRKEKKIFNSGASSVVSGPSTVTLADFMQEMERPAKMKKDSPQ